MRNAQATAKSIFLDALEIASSEARRAFVAEMCAGDEPLRAEIEELLRHHAQLGPNTEAAAFDETRFPTSFDQPGAVIGPYKLLEQIGEGGMGAVYLAEQMHPVQRKVAVKVIKAGMDSRQVIARFEAERQALALMDHPNIAKVLDAGQTGTGRPYFVMELVKGVPITTYCDENQLLPAARLELFVQVCQAVQHAHHKGLIHRDLKPGNVLVARYDDRPVPKVIDFGVAKATGVRLTERTVFTGYGQLVGTLEYMSPEQAQFNALDVDTRGDVYSLGVLLYELLTGVTPFDKQRLRESALDETLRMIREEDPPKPSTRISQMGNPRRGMRNRHDPPSTLRIVHWKELDWIVMKALEKDRNRRYQTANGLALDIQRYLAGEPVEAFSPSTVYRIKKYLRRNRAVAVIVLALLAGIVGTTWGMLRAQQAKVAAAQRAEGERRAKEEAQRRGAQVEKSAEILASVFQDFDPQAAEREGVSFRVLLGQRLLEAVRQLEGEAVADPLVTARLQHVLGISLHELGYEEESRGLLDKALQTRQRLLGDTHLDTVSTKHHLARVYRDQGKDALAETLYNGALAVRTAVLGADHPDTLSTRHYLALLYQAQSRHELAEALLTQVLSLRTTKLGADHPDTLTTQHRLAQLYRHQGKLDRAETMWKEVLSVRTADLGPDHLDTVATKANLAALYHSQGHFEPAEVMYKEVLAVRTQKLGADHPDTLGTRQLLAGLYLWQNNYALAETQLKEVLTIRTAKLGADHPHTLSSQHELARLYHWQGNDELAEAMCKEVLAIGAAKLGKGHHVIHGTRHSLANVYRSLKKLDQSIPLLEDTVRIQTAQFDPNHPETLGMRIDLGLHYCDAGRFADAATLLADVLRPGRREAISETSNVYLIQVLEQVAQHFETSHPEEATKWRKELEKMKP